jgi:hypothetical protein
MPPIAALPIFAPPGRSRRAYVESKGVMSAFQGQECNYETLAQSAGEFAVFKGLDHACDEGIYFTLLWIDG